MCLMIDRRNGASSIIALFYQPVYHRDMTRVTYRLRLALAMNESTECWIPPSSSSWTISHVALYAPSQAALPA